MWVARLVLRVSMWAVKLVSRVLMLVASVAMSFSMWALGLSLSVVRGGSRLHWGPKTSYFTLSPTYFTLQRLADMYQSLVGAKTFVAYGKHHAIVQICN